MGCFDTVMVPCPKCGTENQFQSKGGDCLLREYSLAECPEDVLSDVNRHAPNTCEKCGTVFEVAMVDGKPTVVEVVALDGNDILELHPIRFEQVTEGGSIKIKAVQDYRVLRALVGQDLTKGK